jgi:hypothetical protein
MDIFGSKSVIVSPKAASLTKEVNAGYFALSRNHMRRDVPFANHLQECPTPMDATASAASHTKSQDGQRRSFQVVPVASHFLRHAHMCLPWLGTEC